VSPGMKLFMAAFRAREAAFAAEEETLLKRYGLVQR
jgi:hypothetical protein